MSTSTRSTSPKPAALSSAAAAATSATAAAPSSSSTQQQQAQPQDGSSSSHAWEATGGQHVWEGVREDAYGNIIVSGDAAMTLAQAIRQRRKRMQTNDYARRNCRVVRDMIRYVYVLLDASRWMRQKDPVLPPGTKLSATIQMLHEFVTEYYDQNPLSHLGFVLLQDGEAEIVSPLSSNGAVHKRALLSVAEHALQQGPNGGGEFSLQNGLEVAGRSLGHQPRYGSKEIVILTSALVSADPGFLLTETLPKLQRSRIRVSCFCLSAELHILRKLADATSGAMGVCLDKSHYREWLLQQCVPPPRQQQQQQQDGTSDDSNYCEMISMGFPTRTLSKVPTLVHASRQRTILARTAFVCPQCEAKNSELPCDCAVCGLKLVLAPHLARSFHHLFPVSAFVERPHNTVDITNNNNVEETMNDASGDADVDALMMVPPPVSSSSGVSSSSILDSSLLVSSSDNDKCCYACLKPLSILAMEASSSSSQPMTTTTTTSSKNKKSTASAAAAANNKSAEEELLRFQCPDCSNYFCVDCDAYLHETLHNCPGCLCLF